MDNVAVRPMTNEEVAESCEDAADLLEGAWTKGAWRNEEAGGRITYCIEGALAAALGLETFGMDGDSDIRRELLDCPVYAAVCETILARDADYEPENDGIGGWLPGWNDAELREEQEVLDALRATAKRVLGVAP